MLTDQEIDNLCSEWLYVAPGRTYEEHRPFARAIESAATAPLLARIAELERELEEARKDAELLDYIQTNGATVEIIPGAPDFYPVHFRVGGRYRTANENIRDAIRAAIKDQT